jgi:hypothetical protein
VLHDAGLALVNPATDTTPSGITVGPLTFDDVPVTGGVNVVLRQMTLTSHGQRTVVTRDGACYTVSAGSAQDQLCAAGTPHDDTVIKSLPPALVTLLRSSAGNGIGIITGERAEVWYVDLGQTFAQFLRTSSVTPQALAAVLGMAR